MQYVLMLHSHHTKPDTYFNGHSWDLTKKCVDDDQFAPIFIRKLHCQSSKMEIRYNIDSFRPNMMDPYITLKNKKLGRYLPFEGTSTMSNIDHFYTDIALKSLKFPKLDFTRIWGQSQMSAT